MTVIQSGVVQSSRVRFVFRRQRSLSFFLATFWLGVPLSVFGQNTTVLDTVPRCAECRIRLWHTATVGKFDDPVSLAPFSRIAVAPDGRIFAAPTHAPGEVAVYDRDGAYQRVLGREGDGPGESSGIRMVALGPDGNIHTFGAKQIIWSPGLMLVADQRFGAPPTDLLILETGSVIVNATVFDRERIGYPLHRVDSQGEVVLSFGTDSPAYDYYSPFDSFRRLALPAEGGDRFWAARMNEYRIELWSSDGTLEKVLERPAEWFQPWSGEPPSSWESPPPARIVGISIDDEGLLWVLTLVPDSDWRPAADSEEEADLLGRLHDFFDTRIEIIDPRTNQLVASQRFPRSIGKGSEDGALYVRREDELGIVSFEIYRAELIHTIN